jgi:pimeloyl-ACP methyl ester carboxylesterase
MFDARRAFLGILPIVAVTIIFGEVFMSQASAVSGVKNVALVHGGFVDGSGWQGVYDVLKKDGYNVAIVQNPTTSLADDVAVTKRTLAAMNGPAILVGHSYGGVVDQKPATGSARPSDPAASGRLSVSRSDAVSSVICRGCEPRHGRVHGGLASALGPRGAQRRRQRAGVEVEAKLVSRVGGQDDSARRAARDVETRRLDG